MRKDAPSNGGSAKALAGLLSCGWCIARHTSTGPPQESFPFGYQPIPLRSWKGPAFPESPKCLHLSLTFAKVLTRDVWIGKSNLLLELDWPIPLKSKLLQGAKVFYRISVQTSIFIPQVCFINYAPVAQQDRASDFESAGRRFDSCQAHHYFINLLSFTCNNPPRLLRGFSSPHFSSHAAKELHPECRREENEPDQRLTLTREEESVAPFRTMTYLLSPALDERATGRSSGISRIFSFFWKEGFPPCRRKIQENYDWEKLF